MKSIIKSLPVLLLLSTCSKVETTGLILDTNFEQRLINLGYDDVLDGYLLIANFNNATTPIRNETKHKLLKYN